jgi:hypothetical protein
MELEDRYQYAARNRIGHCDVQWHQCIRTNSNRVDSSTVDVLMPKPSPDACPAFKAPHQLSASGPVGAISERYNDSEVRQTATMNDPHVEALLYTLEPADGVTFDAPHNTWSHDVAEFELDKGQLTARLKYHHADIESARAEVDPIVRSWEVRGGLAYGNADFRFRFLKGETIDRHPTGGVAELAATMTLRVGVDARLSLMHSAFPEPPQDFTATPEVDVMWDRYVAYTQGRERLSGMAYYCLTVVEGLAGGRRNIPRHLNVDLDVARKLGDLTETGGDARTARKVVHGKYRPLTAEEETWVKAVVLMLIKRCGEMAGGRPSLPFISFRDLPPLSTTP